MVGNSLLNKDKEPKYQKGPVLKFQIPITKFQVSSLNLSLV